MVRGEILVVFWLGFFGFSTFLFAKVRVSFVGTVRRWRRSFLLFISMMTMLLSAWFRSFLS